MVRTPWVPKLLTPLQHANRVDCCQELLEESEADPFNFTIAWSPVMSAGYSTIISSADWKPWSGRSLVNRHQLDSVNKYQLENS